MTERRDRTTDDEKEALDPILYGSRNISPRAGGFMVRPGYPHDSDLEPGRFVPANKGLARRFLLRALGRKVAPAKPGDGEVDAEYVKARLPYHPVPKKPWHEDSVLF